MTLLDGAAQILPQLPMAKASDSAQVGTFIAIITAMAINQGL